MWNFEHKGDFTWLFAGDDVINMRQVRRFRLLRNAAAGNTVIVHYIDGTHDSFTGESATVIWKALAEASKSVNVKAG